MRINKNPSPDSKLCRFGEGLFETLKVTEEGRIVFLDRHLSRLYSSLCRLDIPFKMNPDHLEKAVSDFVEKNHRGEREAGLRLTVFDRGYNLSLREIPYKKEDYERGFRVKISSIKRGRSFINRHKTVNYLENIHARREAKSSGCDEALFVNLNDYVLEGAMTNIFLLTSSEVFTPPEELGLLPGIVRREVLDLCREMSVPSHEIKIRKDGLNEFDCAFLTNSLMDLMPVKGIEDIEYDRNGLLQDLRTRFSARVYGD